MASPSPNSPNPPFQFPSLDISPYPSLYPPLYPPTPLSLSLSLSLQISPSPRMASNTQSTFEDFLPIMAHKLGGVALIGELCNGFRLLMDGDKGVITFDSLKKNAAVLGLQELTDGDLRSMLREGDFDGDGGLNQMEFCVLMFRLSPELMEQSQFLLEEALHQELKESRSQQSTGLQDANIKGAFYGTSWYAALKAGSSPLITRSKTTLSDLICIREVISSSRYTSETEPWVNLAAFEGMKAPVNGSF